MAKSKNVMPECPMTVVIDILSGKWKLAIIWQLTHGIARFNEFQRILKVSQKTLTLQLRELEKDGIISRKVYPEVPPKVEYCLTKLGESLRPVLNTMCEWGAKYRIIHENRDVKKDDEIIANCA